MVMAENTSSAATNITNNTDIQSIEALEFQQFLDGDIPVVLFLAVLSIIGTVGNIHSLLVYASSEKLAKRSFRIFILWLSAIDLIACVLCLPIEMIEIRFNYTFSSAVACKFYNFLAYTVSIASGGLLAVIAIERYNINATLLPNAKSSFVGNIISAIVVGISVLLSIPAIVMYGLQAEETEIDNVTTSDCMVLLKYQTLTSIGIYTGIVLLLSTVCCLTCCFAYGNILYTLFKHIRKERQDKKKSEIYHIKSTSIDQHQVGEGMSPIHRVGEMSQNPYSQQRGVDGQTKSTKSSKYDKGIRLTVSFIVATAVSYLAYIIFVTSSLVIFVNPSLDTESTRPVNRILYRAQYINHAVNPVIFCLINKTFRTECQKLYAKSYCGNTCTYLKR